MTRTNTAALLSAAALFASAPSANAEIVTAVQNMPSIAGIHLTLAWLSDAMGEPILEGTIVSTRVYIDYTAVDFFTGEDVEAADFTFGFLAPVPNPPSGTSYVFVNSDLTGWSGVGGDYTYSMESDLYNGEIVSGGFIDMELTGNGTVNAGSRIEFDIEVVPAPAGMGVLAMGGLVATRRRRR